MIDRTDCDGAAGRERCGKDEGQDYASHSAVSGIDTVSLASLRLGSAQPHGETCNGFDKAIMVLLQNSGASMPMPIGLRLCKTRHRRLPISDGEAPSSRWGAFKTTVGPHVACVEIYNAAARIF